MIVSREQIFERDGWRCFECGSEERLTLDHWVPKSKGGSGGPDNLLTMCQRCNERKGSEMPTEPMPERPPLPPKKLPLPKPPKLRERPVRLTDLHPRVRALLVT